MTRTLPTFHTTTERRLGDVFLSVFRRGYRLLQAALRERRQRRRLVTLLACDDATLEDIGYTRPELELALNLPYARNARAQLQCWRECRRITG
ncbi:MAG: hypothetical protein ACX931_10390 [Saccharospirillum sp.]